MIIKNPKIWPVPNSKSSVARNRKAIASRTIVSKNTTNADVEMSSGSVFPNFHCIIGMNQNLQRIVMGTKLFAFQN